MYCVIARKGLRRIGAAVLAAAVLCTGCGMLFSRAASRTRRKRRKQHTGFHQMGGF